MNPNEIDFMKLTPEDYLKMRDRCRDLEKKNAELSDTINRMDGGCKRAIELRRLLDELFEIKPNEFVSDDQIRSKMKGLRARRMELEYENNRQACCIYELKNKVSDLTGENTLLKTKIADLTDENRSQRDHIQEVEDALLTLAREAENSAEQIKNLKFCLTDVSKCAEKYYDEAEAYIRLKNSYRDRCNLLLEEKAGLEKRLRDAESLNDSLMKELANRQGCRPESRVREHDADLYQLDVLKYAPDHHDYLLNVIYAAMGMCGEAGEASELIKKYAYHGHTIDTEHLARELGDVLWYVSYLAHLFGYPLGRIMVMNQEKLAKRYPDGKFDADRSRNREEGDI